MAFSLMKTGNMTIKKFNHCEYAIDFLIFSIVNIGLCSATKNPLFATDTRVSNMFRLFIFNVFFSMSYTTLLRSERWAVLKYYAQQVTLDAIRGIQQSKRCCQRSINSGVIFLALFTFLLLGLSASVFNDLQAAITTGTILTDFSSSLFWGFLSVYDDALIGGKFVASIILTGFYCSFLPHLWTSVYSQLGKFIVQMTHIVKNVTSKSVPIAGCSERSEDLEATESALMDGAALTGGLAPPLLEVPPPAEGRSENEGSDSSQITSCVTDSVNKIDARFIYAIL